MLKLTDIVARGAIVAPLKGKQRDQVIRELIESMVASAIIDREAAEHLYLRVLDRELKSTTGFGKGVAVPHAKDPRMKRISAAIGLSQSGVEFNSLDRQPVYSVVLLISPDDQPNEHLRAMEAIFKHVGSDVFRRLLRQCQDPAQVWSLLLEADAQKHNA
ncbi:MAG: PTS sugar transporter subunit IIA [Phycisphaerales bacterium]|nr:PTS sugar transporter subunit IIA [Phycisphaerales bacterium]